jgi:N6-L-threonylcarbamoyladenine synthase
MLILGIETSCDETGVALYDTHGGLLGHALHSQVALHAEYGGVVPEIASRDHVRRVLPLARDLLARGGHATAELGAVAYTRGPGLAGALLVGASIAHGLAYALEIPAIGIHHLEGHLLSPLLFTPSLNFPFVALLVSGGHSQLMRVAGVGRYELLGETHDDAAGEAFDKTAKLLGLPYPGGPALAKLADRGIAGRYSLPRPMLEHLERSGDLNFSFSGLKTAVVTLVNRRQLDDGERADVAAEFQSAIVDVLVRKSLEALHRTGLTQLVVAGGVGANRQLREQLAAGAHRRGYRVHYPPLEFCTDNGAMIAFAAALRLRQDSGAGTRTPGFGIQDAAKSGFTINPRWALDQLPPPDRPSGNFSES